MPAVRPSRAVARVFSSWLVVGLAACGGSADDTAGGVGVGGGAGVGSGSGGAVPDAAPPEKELESSYGAPVATGSFVWIPNPASGRVAYIDAKALKVETVEAGNGPTYLAPVPAPNADVAIVLNVLSYDATLLRAEQGHLTTDSLPVPSGGNAWAVSSDGRWAIAWTDARGVPSASAADGYQDITVLDLTEGALASTPLTVGYRPVALAFDAAGSRAFAVTGDGITVIELAAKGAPLVSKNVKLSEDALDDAAARDVAITPDGAYAVVRRDGKATISVFALADGARTDVLLPAPATDMDLSTDGTVAVVVLRDTSQVALLPVPGIVDSPAAFPLVDVPEAIVGSAALAAKSPTALLYTNGIPSSLLTSLDISSATPVPHSVLLHAPVEAVFPTPDAAHALVLHGAVAPDAPDAGAMAYPGALSLVPLAADLPSKILGLDAPPVSVAIDPQGTRALVATGDEAHPSYHVHVASMPSLQIQSYPLGSLPIAAGIVAGAGKGFVAQKHPDGRITFVDFDSGDARTITGFELASQVSDGSEP